MDALASAWPGSEILTKPAGCHAIVICRPLNRIRLLSALPKLQLCFGDALGKSLLEQGMGRVLGNLRHVSISRWKASLASTLRDSAAESVEA
jgi:hypothetical protein